MQNCQQLILQSVINKNDFVRDADNALDNKCGVLLAASAAIIAISFSTTNLLIITEVKLYFASTGLLFGFLCISGLLWITAPKSYLNIIGDKILIQKYLNLDEKTLALQLISNTQYAFDSNNEILLRKVKKYKFAGSA